VAVTQSIGRVRPLYHGPSVRNETLTPIFVVRGRRLARVPTRRVDVLNNSCHPRPRRARSAAPLIANAVTLSRVGDQPRL
jgi:hypothetical protein